MVYLTNDFVSNCFGKVFKVALGLENEIELIDFILFFVRLSLLLILYYFQLRAIENGARRITELQSNVKCQFL